MAFDPDAYLATENKKKGFDPDAYLAKTAPESATQTFGRSAASLADSALNALTGTLDYGAYGLARAFGRTPEQAQAETTSPKDVVGRAFGVAGTPGYEQAPLRQLGGYVGQALGENVIQPLAQSTGLPEQDVANMVNTGMMAVAPAIPKVVKPVAGAVRDVSGGAFGAATGRTAAPGVAPKSWQTASVRQPVGETYIPANVLEQYRLGQLTAEQAQALARPTSELSGLAATGGTVPYAGQGMRAFGESLGETYRNPLNIITDVGAGMLSGGPALTAGRLGYKGYQAYNANKLSNLGFTPLSSAEATALGSGGPAGPISPTTSVRQQAAAKINTQALPPDVIAAQQAAAQARVAAAEAAAIERQANQPAAQQPIAGPVVPSKPPPSMYASLTPEQQAAIDKMTGLNKKKVAEPAPNESSVVPFESAEQRALARAELKAETPLTPREKLDKTLQSAYNQVKNQGRVLDKKLIDETLAGEGLPPVDWNKLGTDYQSMSIKDGRKAIQKFVETETGLRGPGTRGPNSTTVMKAANERLAMEQAQRTPAEVAQELTDMQAAIERRKRVLGDKYRAPGRGMEMKTGPENKSSIPRPNFPEGSKGNPFATLDDAKMQYMNDTLVGNSDNNPPGKFTYSIKDNGNEIFFNKSPNGSTEYNIYKPDGGQEIYRYMPENKQADVGSKYIKHDIDKNGVQKRTSFTEKPDWWPTLSR